MKTIVLTCGIAGSGKSTWVKENYALTCPSVCRINADAIRYMLYGNEDIQGSGKRVFELVFVIYREALANPKVDTIIIDNTNINSKTRMQYYSIAKEYDQTTLFKLVFFPDHQRACKQNDARDRTVPADVMRRMIMNYEETTVDEFSVIEHIEVLYV
jgi:predicted kinase